MTDQTSLPRFSIVLPSFNTCEYIRETIDSILSQDYPDFEFIVVDGGSNDGTVEILESYGDRIRWISEKDDGQSDAINKGFGMATGELHYWANADDPLEPGALRHVASLLTNFEEPQWVVGAANVIDGRGRVLFERHVEKVDDATFLLWALKWIPTQSVFWNRKMWEEAGPFDPHLHYVMDLGLWQRMYRTAPCAVTSRILARYRLHNQSKSLSGFQKSQAERKKHLAIIIAGDLERARGDGEEAIEELTRRYAVLFDELSDQAALVERLTNHRFFGPLMRFYKRNAGWYPQLKI